MRPDRFLLCWVLLLGCFARPAGGAKAVAPTVETWRFQTVDGVELFADYRAPEVAGKAPLIVLLHQAGGDGRGEYAPIVPRLAAQGYATLQVDLRSGGDRFGGVNRTAAGQAGREWSYCEAEADLDAVLDEIRRRELDVPLLLWGSSYSAALAVRVGARRASEVAAIASFSPASGGPMESCSAEGLWKSVTVPLIVFRPQRETSYPPVAEQLARQAAAGVPVFTAAGSHGSSFLVEERGSSDAELAWRRLGEFLADVLPPPGVSRRIGVGDSALVADFLPPLTASPWPTALLLHSAASERGRLEGLAVRLAAEGVASLRVDLRGHGESLDRGRFEAGRVAETRHLLEEAPEDVAAALGALAAERGADRRPPAVVASSYSVEAAARAARSGAPVAAWVALSPGDFSAQSIAWAGAEAKSWWFLRSEREPDFFDELFARLERGVPQAEITVLSAGGHGDSLLAEYPGLDRRIARWVAEQLSNAGPAGTSAAFDR